jgi:hypothetical protein
MVKLLPSMLLELELLEWFPALDSKGGIGEPNGGEGTRGREDVDDGEDDDGSTTTAAAAAAAAAWAAAAAAFLAAWS